jgi:uncharacterized protein YchJ
MFGQNCQAFTTSYRQKVNALITDIGISLPFNPTADQNNQQPSILKCAAIWDTGATNSVITEKMAGQLKLKPTSMVEVRGVHGVKIKNAYLINVYLPNKTAFSYVKVTECEEFVDSKLGMLIGMDIITSGDFAVTNFLTTVLSFRQPSLEKIDFVEIARTGRREKNEVGRNDKCPCGSGKKYKKCCGR